MKLCFDTVEELRAFVKNDLKAKRGGAADVSDEGTATGNAPAPIQPPAGGTQGGGFPGAGGFAAPGPGAAPAGAGFPAAGAVDPAVTALVNRISARIDVSVAAPPQGLGQPIDNVLQWFRGQCGPEAANFTMDQIKQHALPKMSVPALDNIAKLIAA